MFIVKHNGAYYTGKFEIEGTVIMVNHSSEKNDAKLFNTEHEIEEEMKNIKNYDYEIERVENNE